MLDKMLRAMRSPESVVLKITYKSKSGAITRRIISPIRFTGYHVLALCVGRGEVRQFAIDRISEVVEVDANEVLMPSGVETEVSECR
jgi:predicted DNA-binding transcriptional regulator YafY